MTKSKDQILEGVCGGIAEHFEIDPTIIRLLTVLFIGYTFWPYVILVFIMEEPK